MTELDNEHVVDLKESMDTVGQIQDNVVCKQHPDRLLVGRHRREAGASRVMEYDVDELAQRKGWTHEVAERMVSFSSNVQRPIPEKERREQLIELAELEEKNGVPVEEVSTKLSQMLGSKLSERYVQILLPAKYKKATKASAGKKGAKRTAEMISAPETEGAILARFGSRKTRRTTIPNQPERFTCDCGRTWERHDVNHYTLAHTPNNSTTIPAIEESELQA